MRNIAVTSLAEVWIETISWQPDTMQDPGHFPCGSVDWNKIKSVNDDGTFMSLPLRKCGLKLHFSMPDEGPLSHFPCGSVDWNSFLLCFETILLVTSLAEVWIETCSQYCLNERLWSLPLRKCGLKQSVCRVIYKTVYVTSLAEVWIETGAWSDCCHCSTVTSLAEVWIETCRNRLLTGACAVTSLAEVWIETVIPSLRRRLRSSLPLRKCGLKQFCRSAEKQRLGHFPCGSVDWNCKRW